MGILDAEHVTNHELRQIVKLEVKARQLREQLAGATVATGRYQPERRAAPTALVVRG